MSEQLQRRFPQLAAAAFSITSPATPEYNCIAWAAGETDRWWWPDAAGLAYWPPGIRRQATLESFLAAFATRGYVACDDGGYEPGNEKVALYVDAAGQPTHMARQLASGAWTSKLGKEADITHQTLQGLEGSLYGTVVRFLKRPTA